jgi:hypothetical protein
MLPKNGIDAISGRFRSAHCWSRNAACAAVLVDQFAKRSLLCKPDCSSAQPTLDAETRRGSLNIASKAIFRYYFLIR